MTIESNLALIRLEPYSYRSPDGLDQPVFALLEHIRAELDNFLPFGYSVKISRGVGGLPVGLWLAILNDDITTSPTRGIYLVLLFDVELKTVSLSLNQGIAQATEAARNSALTRNQLLRAEGDAIRAILPEWASAAYEHQILLGKGARVEGYEAGNILARTWNLSSPPSDDGFLAEVDVFLDLYERAVWEKERALRSRPGKFVLPARGEAKSTSDPIFAPKSSASYLIQARKYIEPQVRRRDHERLVRDFGEHAIVQGFVPATNRHPIDLVLSKGRDEIIVEVKMLEPVHPAGGIRESIGQLFEYRKFFRPDSPRTPILAVYNAEPAQAFIELLSELEIAAIWQAPDAFGRTDLATKLGL